MPSWRRRLAGRYIWSNPSASNAVLAMQMLQNPDPADLASLSHNLGVPFLREQADVLDRGHYWSSPSARGVSVLILNDLQNQARAGGYAEPVFG